MDDLLRDLSVNGYELNLDAIDGLFLTNLEYFLMSDVITIDDMGISCSTIR